MYLTDLENNLGHFANCFPRRFKTATELCRFGLDFEPYLRHALLLACHIIVILFYQILLSANRKRSGNEINVTDKMVSIGVVITVQVVLIGHTRYLDPYQSS